MTEIKKARSSVGALEQAGVDVSTGNGFNVQPHHNTAAADWQGKLALRPRELAVALGVGHNAAYALCKTEGFPSVRVGRNFIVPVDSLRRWLAAQAEGGAVGDS